MTVSCASGPSVSPSSPASSPPRGAPQARPELALAGAELVPLTILLLSLRGRGRRLRLLPLLLEFLAFLLRERPFVQIARMKPSLRILGAVDVELAEDAGPSRLLLEPD